ncbi:MAG TPA: 50S ribosomal protein L30 [Caldilineaceae bacterium]|nr:50S ribosomal protein L30 [Caldilineaceae bacterium]
MANELANHPGNGTGKTIQVKLVRSPIGYNKTQKATVRALGLTKLHQVVEKEDTPVIRGMINRVSHLVQVVEFK